MNSWQKDGRAAGDDAGGLTLLDAVVLRHRQRKNHAGAEFEVGIRDHGFLGWFSPELQKKYVHGSLLLQYRSVYGETCSTTTVASPTRSAPA